MSKFNPLICDSRLPHYVRVCLLAQAYAGGTGKAIFFAPGAADVLGISPQQFYYGIRAAIRLKLLRPLRDRDGRARHGHAQRYVCGFGLWGTTAQPITEQRTEPATINSGQMRGRLNFDQIVEIWNSARFSGKGHVHLDRLEPVQQTLALTDAWQAACAAGLESAYLLVVERICSIPYFFQGGFPGSPLTRNASIKWLTRNPHQWEAVLNGEYDENPDVPAREVAARREATERADRERQAIEATPEYRERMAKAEWQTVQAYIKAAENLTGQFRQSKKQLDDLAAAERTRIEGQYAVKV